MSLVEELRKAQIFSGFEALELEHLARAGTRHELDEGHVFLRMGDGNSSLYVILSGSVSVDRRIGEQDLWLATLGTGHSFGEMSLLDGSAATATLTATEPTALLELSRESLDSLQQDSPLLWGKLWHNVARDLKRRLVETSDLISHYADIDQVLEDVPSFRDNLGRS
jgi:CRP-like cAMP-binding protein